MAQHRSLFTPLLLLALCSTLGLADFFPDYDHYPPEFRHDRVRRFVRFISRKPHPDALPESGIGFRGHVKNLLKGGTFGLEFQIPHVDRFGKRFPHWNDVIDSFDRRGIGAAVAGDKKAGDGKDFEMLERDGDYGHLINPRVKKEEP